MLRIWIACALFGLLLAGPAAANPAICARDARQIGHYEDRLARARAIGSAEQEALMQQHLNLLRARAAGRCPDLAADDSAARAFAEFLRLAGKAALTYFTFGAF